MARQYTCSKCGGQGHGRDDCGKSRVPSSGRQAPLALLPNPNEPSPSPSIDETYSAFLISQGYSPALDNHIPMSNREGDDFIAPPGDDIALAQSGSSLPKELNIVARNLISSLGMDKDSDSILTNVVQSLELDRDTRIVPADEAATSLAALHPIDGTLGNGTIENVRSGRILLTYSELAILRGIRNEVDARQQLSYLAPLDSGGEWIPTVEQRHCTICGQFVGVLKSHNCDVAAGRKLLSELHEHQGHKEKSVTLTILSAEGSGMQEWKTTAYSMKDLDEVPVEHLQDLYLVNEDELAGKNSSVREALRAQIIMGFYQKRVLGEGKLLLPAQLRAAYLESPAVAISPLVVVETIEPPLAKHEIEKLINSLDNRPDDVARLLLSPKAKDSVAYVLENKPSQAGAALAREGRLSEGILSGMSSCGDQMVRRQAATAPNLDEMSIRALATDPDADVRAALLFGAPERGRGYSADTPVEDRLFDVDPWGNPSFQGAMWDSAVTRNPQLLSEYVNDPDERLALGALAAFPYSRQSMHAIGQVTSRQRLETIAARLDEIWPYYSTAPEPPSRLGRLSRRQMRGALQRHMRVSEVDATAVMEQVRALIAKRLS